MLSLFFPKFKITISITTVIVQLSYFCKKKKKKVKMCVRCVPFKGGLVFGAQIFAGLFHPLAKTQL